MADTAAHLVDRVFPRVPVRQWVLSLPYALRYRLAYDTSLVTALLAVFTRTVFASLIRRAREFGAERGAQCGAVTFIQRFGSALNLNLHLHMLAFDGVYAANENDRPHFQALLAPEDDEIVRLTASLAQRITSWLPVVAWDRTAIRKNRIRCAGMSRGWLGFTRLPYRARRRTVPMPVVV